LVGGRPGSSGEATAWLDHAVACCPNQPIQGENVSYPITPTEQLGHPIEASAQAPRRRRGLKITLGIFGLLLVLCVGGGAFGYTAYMGPVNKEKATLTAPEQVAGMSKLTDPSLQETADGLAASLKAQLKATSTIAAYYAPAGDQQHLVAVWGATGAVHNPDGELTSAFKGTDLEVADIRAVPAGSLGGAARCGTGSTQGLSFAMCIWADHGSMGAALFFNRTVEESAPLFITIREATLHRG
jgi:hypothetical protein